MLCSRLKIQFLKDTKIPIQVIQSPYFEYFLDLYEKDYKAKTKYSEFCNVVIQSGGEDNYIALYNNLIRTVKEDILSIPAYQRFLTENGNKFNVGNLVDKKDLYVEENSGKIFISIDLKQANFNAFKLYDKEIVKNAETYEDFIGKYTDIQCIINSKNFRQVLFGNLNTKRNKQFQKYILSKIIKRLLSLGFNKDNIFSTSSDEIVIEIESIEKTNMLCIDDICFYCNENNIPINLSIYKLNKISKLKNFYVKEFLYTNNKENQKVEFKGIPDYFFAQMYKQYNNQELEEYDKVFFFEREIAFFRDFLEILKDK